MNALQGAIKDFDEAENAFWDAKERLKAELEPIMRAMFPNQPDWDDVDSVTTIGAQCNIRFEDARTALVPLWIVEADDPLKAAQAWREQELLSAQERESKRRLAEIERLKAVIERLEAQAAAKQGKKP